MSQPVNSRANPSSRWVEGLKELAGVIGFLAFILCLIVLGGME